MFNQYYVNQVCSFHHNINYLASQCLIISSYVNQSLIDSGSPCPLTKYIDGVSGMIVRRLSVDIYAEYMRQMYELFG